MAAHSSRARRVRIRGGSRRVVNRMPTPPLEDFVPPQSLDHPLAEKTLGTIVVAAPPDYPWIARRVLHPRQAYCSMHAGLVDGEDMEMTSGSLPLADANAVDPVVAGELATVEIDEQPVDKEANENGKQKEDEKIEGGGMDEGADEGADEEVKKEEKGKAKEKGEEKADGIVSPKAHAEMDEKTSKESTDATADEKADETTDQPSGGPRRNPKRKAGAMTNDDIEAKVSNDDVLEETLAPMTLQEMEEWQGWIELESEPAFFNTILERWGVKDVRIQEVFGVDESAVVYLPKPIYGLVFLFQVAANDGDSEEEPQSSSIWFANQTISNACASVALLNILMNGRDIDLGDKLQEFKEATKDKVPALRGHLLSENAFIRKHHNFLIRRMDQLNADLFLRNEADDDARKRQKKTKKPASRRTPRKKLRPTSDSACHFIAYVPSDDFIWELDGMKSNPVCLGRIPTTTDWTVEALPRIAARVQQYEDDQYSFSLLALCRSPLAYLSRTIAATLRAIQLLEARFSACPDWSALVQGEQVPLDGANDADLGPFGGLTTEAVRTAPVASSVMRKIDNPALDVADGYEVYQQLLVDLRSSVGQYQAEVANMSEDRGRVQGRQMNYMPACHAWLRKLAESGKLEDLIEQVK